MSKFFIGFYLDWLANQDRNKNESLAEMFAESLFPTDKKGLKKFMNGYEGGYLDIAMYRDEFREIVQEYERKSLSKKTGPANFLELFHERILNKVEKKYYEISMYTRSKKTDELKFQLGWELGNTFAFIWEFLIPYGDWVYHLKNEILLGLIEKVSEWKRIFWIGMKYPHRPIEIFTYRIKEIYGRNRENKILVQWVNRTYGICE